MNDHPNTTALDFTAVDTANVIKRYLDNADDDQLEMFPALDNLGLYDAIAQHLAALGANKTDYGYVWHFADLLLLIGEKFKIER